MRWFTFTEYLSRGGDGRVENTEEPDDETDKGFSGEVRVSLGIRARCHSCCGWNTRCHSIVWAAKEKLNQQTITNRGKKPTLEGSQLVCIHPEESWRQQTRWDRAHRGRPWQTAASQTGACALAPGKVRNLKQKDPSLFNNLIEWVLLWCLLWLLTFGRMETTESPTQMMRLMEAKNSWSLHWPEYSPV